MTMLESPADVLRGLLIGLGLCSSPGYGSPWPVFVANEPPYPDDCVTVLDAGAPAGARTMNAGERVPRPAVVIRVRSGNRPDAYAKAEEIALALDRVRDVEIGLEGSTLVRSIRRSPGVVPVGADEVSARCTFAVTARLVLRPLEEIEP